MKKTLFMLLISLPFGEGWGGVLWAQNGVTVGGLAVNAGSPATVTFDVNWSRQAMQDLNLTVWSDTVWVFVDYNDAGEMTRLPLLPGATLTATSAPGTGKVLEEAGNNTGVWVAGNARTDGSFSATVRLLTSATDIAGACVYASNYPPVGEYTAADKITFTGTPPYDIVLKHGSGNTITVQSGSTFLLPCGYTVASFTDATTGAPGTFMYIPQDTGTAQSQGNCTYTEPAALTAFAAFPSNYSSSTYVTLTDERDGKNYPVAKIGGRWIMARNLNYQTGLTWQANSKDPSTVSGSNTALIGHFWCPGASGATTSARASCEAWGAFYSWETAMMVDGKWTSDAHGSSTWSEPASYGTATASGNTQNHGRAGNGGVTGGRGICPPSWHVPTDAEWGDIFNAMETGTKNHNTATGWIGTNVGVGGKSTCTGAATDANAYWTDHANRGTDLYGFRALPAGYRYRDGSIFNVRGTRALFWTSSAINSANMWYREFDYGSTVMNRSTNTRSHGLSVRCIRDEG
jgi:uncharacterized protein (TIGR02145 family)